MHLKKNDNYILWSLSSNRIAGGVQTLQAWRIPAEKPQVGASGYSMICGYQLHIYIYVYLYMIVLIIEIYIIYVSSSGQYSILHQEPRAGISATTKNKLSMLQFHETASGYSCLKGSGALRNTSNFANEKARHC